MTDTRFEAVVMGASAGALDALSTILPALPGDYRLPVMVVVHLPPDKKSVLAELLNAKCRMKVMEAEDKEPMQPGTVYLAPADYHMLVEDSTQLSLTADEPILFSRPSINVLFETAAETYKDGLVGIILTGASNDGAKGLAAIAQAGGTTIVQQPSRAFASAMPQAALESCEGAQVLSLEQITAFLKNIHAGQP